MTLRATTTITLAAALLATIPACGGDDGIDCSFDDPCGGDPTGDWDIAGTCVPPEQQQGLEDCPQATLTTTVSLAGSMSFGSDMTYERQTDTATILIARLPLTCLQVQQPGLASCEAATSESTRCTTSGDLCDCRVISTSTASDTGTWVASGATLTLTDQFGSVRTPGFCVDGDTLKLLDANLTTGEAEVTVLER